MTVSELGASGDDIEVKAEQDFAVLLFASLRDAAGADGVSVSIPESVNPVTVSSLLEACAVQYPLLAAWLPHIKVAVNCEYATPDFTVTSRDEIALLPPVSGG
ncbi:MAG TPA: MoaD/ThiS family protein [Abditibacteriaceae bacterium]|jgi:molybdopterin converting factor subunit 1